MTTVDIIATDGEQVGAVELPPDIFDVQANIALMHQVVVAQLAAARQGTHKTKTRGEVRGGGKKPYKQKGTGRARQGSIRAPQFTGGGVVHGPVPRDYSQRTPKKMKAAALRGALSDRARAGRITVVETFVDDETPSTKAALRVLGSASSSAARSRSKAGRRRPMWTIPRQRQRPRPKSPMWTPRRLTRRPRNEHRRRPA